ncbi:unnamed protein product [Protopolystoma xenopodis]|uniref:Uncharacterized protein n=1 Tax=Protopolystoma xenopodis TaxID=117903 RepID=A0A3S5FCM1_9PLAT|nr:unnamed protein product [Protopolystoma xenopodis]
MEIERKKARTHKTTQLGPMIRFHSFTVPDIGEQPNAFAVAIDYKSGDVVSKPLIVNREARCARSLVTFADLSCLRSALPASADLTLITGVTSNCSQHQSATSSRPKRRMRLCPITGQPAKYVIAFILNFAY